MAFVQTQPRMQIWRIGETRLSRVLSWYDARGNRWFTVRQRGKRFDLRVIAGQEVTAEREAISLKAVVLAARTIGILLTEEQIQALLSSPVAQ